jgi:hypothetical protein
MRSLDNQLRQPITGYSAATGRRGNPSVKVLRADDQFVGVFAEAVRAWLWPLWRFRANQNPNRL